MLHFVPWWIATLLLSVMLTRYVSLDFGDLCSVRIYTVMIVSNHNQEFIPANTITRLSAFFVFSQLFLFKKNTKVASLLHPFLPPNSFRFRVISFSQKLSVRGGFDPHLCTLEHKYVAELQGVRKIYSNPSVISAPQDSLPA